jgi:hypothetical protein
MNGVHQTVRLYFAVLDGANPRTWSLYGKSFPELMQDACYAARPEAVSADLLQDYSVQVEPIWSGPEQLLEETALDAVVGVIIDAFPKQDPERDHAEKVDTLRRLVRRLQDRNRGNADALFRRFGYSIWFMTDKSSRIGGFVGSVRDAAAAIIGPKSIEHQVFKDKDWLALHLTSYVENVYFRLAQARE